MPFDSERGRKSHVYVLPELVHGRELSSANSVALYHLMQSNYHLLHEDMRRQFDRYVSEQDTRMGSMAGWSKNFFAACATRGPWPTRKGVYLTDWFVPGTTERNPKLTIAMLALRYVYEMGAEGATANEAKAHYRMASDGFSGALSAAHKSGAIACLKEKR